MELSLYAGEFLAKRNEHWIARSTTWEKILKWPSKAGSDKERAGSYILGELRAGVPTRAGRARCGEVCGAVHRNKASVVSRNALTFDVDRIPGADAGAELRATLESYGYEALVHTTYSSTPERPRYRVIVPLTRAVTPVEYAAVSRALMDELGREMFDAASAYPWHLMFLPAGPEGRVESWHIGGGEFLDPDALIEAWEIPLDGYDPYGGLIGAGGSGSGGSMAGEPTASQLAEAQVMLRDFAAIVGGWGDGETRGEITGRNSALLSYLTRLYQLVLGGCLSEAEVDDVMGAAADENGLGESEYAAVQASAWRYAGADGGWRPEGPEDLFTRENSSSGGSSGGKRDGTGGPGGEGEEDDGCGWNECGEARADGGRFCAEHKAQRDADVGKQAATGVVEYEKHNVAIDIHVARRIAVEYLEPKVRAFGRNGWGVWDGKRWDTEASEDKINRLLHLAALDIHRKEEAIARKRMEKESRAGGAEGESARANYNARMKELNRLLMSRFIRDIVRMVRPYISVSPVVFDGKRTRDYLNCPNGIVDLRTGEVTPHRRDMYFTKVTGAKYVPGAEHPDWTTAIEGALPPTVGKYLKRRLGQAITGYPPSDDVATFLGGGGANGKSTVVDAVHVALGGFYSNVPKSILLDGPKHDSLYFELKGVRLAVIEELPRGRWLDVDTLKDVTGTNGMKARAMRETHYTHWSASHTLFVTSNYAVKVVETDWSVWRRLEKILFSHTFGGPDSDRPGDPGLRDRLRESRDGQAEAVLAWLVEGAGLWYAEGLSRADQPEEVVAETAKWKMSGNPIVQFTDEVLAYDPRCAALGSDVYAAYRAFTTTTGGKPVNDQTFWSRMMDTDLLRQPGVERENARTGGWDIAATRDIGVKERILTGVRINWALAGLVPFADYKSQ